MDFKSKIINSIINDKRNLNQSLIKEVKKDVENQKKKFEKFEQLLVLGIQNKNYNLSLR